MNEKRLLKKFKRFKKTIHNERAAEITIYNSEVDLDFDKVEIDDMGEYIIIEKTKEYEYHYGVKGDLIEFIGKQEKDK